ncbi:alpha/beta hydrolase fold [Persephonella hydrogeniphila]|uniref:Alpha/beta hydrolase fold n=2 Tax=Persephonella hydrogeniphila TaxID=198703 RepID=A0A285MZJ7_9AQUI|nr:alpha/beta hydrolase fold [Persephonella hydrogeniphila]
MVYSKEIAIESDDGFMLKGFLEYPDEKKDKYPVIIFAHQFGTTHMIWSEFAKELREKGFATLLLDLRGHGLSIFQKGKENKIVFNNRFSSLLDLVSFFKKSNKKVNFSKIPDDIALWIDYLIENEKIDPDRIILIGASLGATSIIPVVSMQDIYKMVCISPGSPEIVGEDRVKLSLSSYMNPVMYISSLNDPLGSYKYSKYYMENSNNGTLLIVSGKGHGVVLLKKVKGYILQFLK